MSEILDSAPSLDQTYHSFKGDPESESKNTIDFDTLEIELQYINPELAQSNYAHYEQEQRIIGLYLQHLDLAISYYSANEFHAAQSQIEAIIMLVKPTANMYLLGLLQEAHDKLYT